MSFAVNRETDYTRYSIRLGRQDDIRKPHEVIYSLILLFLGLFYLVKRHIFIVVLLFWIWLGLGLIYYIIYIILKWKQSIEAARHARESVILERILLRQLEENAELELERISSTRETRRESRRQSRRHSSSRDEPQINRNADVEIEHNVNTVETNDNNNHCIDINVTRFDSIGTSGLNVSTYQLSSDSESTSNNHTSKIQGNQSMVSSCSICLDEFGPSDQVNRLFCTHIFHDKCLEQWMLTKPDRTCPICRQPLASEI